MWSRRVAPALVGFALAGLALASSHPPRAPDNPHTPGAERRQVTYPATLAPGEGRVLAEQHCLICHSAMLITQQHKDSTGWEKTLALMEKWSAPLDSAGHRNLRAYLLRRYGPRSGHAPDAPPGGVQRTP